MTNNEIAAGYDWCVAGGWAACPQLAGDQDVWIFGDIASDQTKLLMRLLKVPGFVAAKEEEQHEDYILRDASVRIAKVGTLGNRHIMVTSATDEMDLLKQFDISTHQCALTSDMEFIAGPEWTPITQAPIALFPTPQTPARLEKIRARYVSLQTRRERRIAA